jgi:DNA end-binding protein Ku
MRSIWKGSVSFGLVSIGVKMYAATEERDVSFHQVRRSDGSRIRYKRIAEADGEEVAYADIAKGYALPNGDVVVLTDEDFADLPLPTARVVDVVQFVPLEQVDPIFYAKSYYLEPEASAVKPYVLLREALEESGMVGLVKVAIRNREQLAILRVRDDVILLETMIWPDEVREAQFGFLDTDIAIRPQEAKMAASLVASMAGDFDPSQFTDEYRAALEEVIEAKVEGREVVEAAEPETSGGGEVVDLMAALRASVDAAKQGRSASGSGATGHAASAASASRKATAKAPARASASKPASAPAAKAAKAPAKAAAKSAKAPAKTSGRSASASAKVPAKTAAKATRIRKSA